VIFPHFVVKPCRFELSGAVGDPRNPTNPIAASMDVLVEIKLEVSCQED